MHPYTLILLNSIPHPDPRVKKKKVLPIGESPTQRRNSQSDKPSFRLPVSHQMSLYERYMYQART